MRTRNFENAASFVPGHGTVDIGPAHEFTEDGQFDLQEKLRALAEEKQNLLLLVCDLLRKNEILRSSLSTSRMNRIVPE
jgi:hypothetical protein